MNQQCSDVCVVHDIQRYLPAAAMQIHLDIISGSFDSFVLKSGCCPEAFAVQVCTEKLAAMGC